MMTTKEIRTNLLISQLAKLFTQSGPESLTDIKDLSFKKILVIAPHADDEVIGCGAALQHFVTKGAHVCVLVVTQESERSIAKTYNYHPKIRIEESYNAQNILGYNDLVYFDFPELMLKRNLQYQKDYCNQLSAFIKEYEPDCIFLPNNKEMHPDHQIIGELSKRVVLENVRNGFISQLAAMVIYEIWGVVSMNSYVKLTEEAYQRKIKSIECYQSQMVSVDYIKIIDFIGSHRGHILGNATAFENDKRSVRAEAFELYTKDQFLN